MKPHSESNKSACGLPSIHAFYRGVTALTSISLYGIWIFGLYAWRHINLFYIRELVSCPTTHWRYRWAALCRFLTASIDTRRCLYTRGGVDHVSFSRLSTVSANNNYYFSAHALNLQHTHTYIYIYIYVYATMDGCRDVHEPETHVVATRTSYRDVAKSRQCKLSSNDSKRHKMCKKNWNLKHFWKVTLMQGYYRDFRIVATCETIHVTGIFPPSVLPSLAPNFLSPSLPRISLSPTIYTTRYCENNRTNKHHI